MAVFLTRGLDIVVLPFLLFPGTSKALLEMLEHLPTFFTIPDMKL